MKVSVSLTYGGAPFEFGFCILNVAKFRFTVLRVFIVAHTNVLKQKTHFSRSNPVTRRHGPVAIDVSVRLLNLLILRHRISRTEIGSSADVFTVFRSWSDVFYSVAKMRVTNISQTQCPPSCIDRPECEKDLQEGYDQWKNCIPFPLLLMLSTLLENSIRAIQYDTRLLE